MLTLGFDILITVGRDDDLALAARRPLILQDDAMALQNIELRGFKSIDGERAQSISLGAMTVLLGANGAGKSNLLSFFKFLSFMTTNALPTYVERVGAETLLFQGPAVTPSFSFSLEFKHEDQSISRYEAELSYGQRENLFVSRESVSHRSVGAADSSYDIASTDASKLGILDDDREPGKAIRRLLSGIRVFQFHDTSDTAKIKNRGYKDDARYLRSDAGNLAAFLRRLNNKENELHQKYYQRILRHIRRVLPQFGDFFLDPISSDGDYLRLNWKDSSGSGFLLSPHQLSDGSLRFMALATLLLQPPELLPDLIVIDEPELGLHPSAISELAAMIRMASQKAQILLATQSTRLVDEFSADNVVTVDWDAKKHCSIFQRLNEEALRDWLANYSLSELWEKSVIGGQV